MVPADQIDDALQHGGIGDILGRQGFPLDKSDDHGVAIRQHDFRREAGGIRRPGDGKIMLSEKIVLGDVAANPDDEMFAGVGDLEITVG